MVLAEKGVSEDKAKITRDSHVWVYLKPKFTVMGNFSSSVISNFIRSVISSVMGNFITTCSNFAFRYKWQFWTLSVIILDFISDVISDNVGWMLYKKIFRVYFQENIVIMNCNKGRDCSKFTTQFTQLTIHNSVYNSSSIWLRCKNSPFTKNLPPSSPSPA